MAHLKRYGPQLNDNIEKVEIFFKNGVPPPSEVSLSRIVSPQKAVFRVFFKNHFSDPSWSNDAPKCYTWMESCGSQLSDGKNEKLFFCILQSVGFSMTLRTDIFLYTEKLSYVIFGVQNYPSRPVPLPEVFVTTRPDPVPKSKTTTRQSLPKRWCPRLQESVDSFEFSAEILL